LARSKDRVEVVYFPKRGKVKSRAEAALTDLPTELFTFNDPPTEPLLLADLQKAIARAERGEQPRRTTPLNVPAVGSVRGKSPTKTPVKVPKTRAATKELMVQLKRGGKKPSRQMVGELSLKGHSLFESGRLHEARNVFQALVDAQVDEAFPYTMLGTIHMAIGQLQDALELFQKALAIDPRELSALVYRGEIRLMKGQVEAALKDLNRAIGLGRGRDPFVERAKKLIHLAQRPSKRGKKRI
jgi:tetratricopeptide (TPR) repeat protein